MKSQRIKMVNRIGSFSDFESVRKAFEMQKILSEKEIELRFLHLKSEFSIVNILQNFISERIPQFFKRFFDK